MRPPRGSSRTARADRPAGSAASWSRSSSRHYRREFPTALAATGDGGCDLDAVAQTARADKAHKSRRHAEHQSEVSNVRGDEGVRADEGPAADRPERLAAHDRGVRPDPRPFAEERAPERP